MADTGRNVWLEYWRRFGSEPLVVRSPGRINLIGEHTDYNDGFVLPGAINKAVHVAVGKNNDQRIRLFASAYGQMVDIEMDEVKPSPMHSWVNYILGVVDQLAIRGLTVPGFNLVIDGDIPLGAGLSSSAAAECATAFALNHLFGFNIPRLELALLSQKAEHEFAGVKCGIMDQFASMFGMKGHVIKLDCRSLAHEYKPVKLNGYTIVLLDTQVKHALASSAYNKRREECEFAVRLMNQKYPHVRSLRDATMKMVNECVKPVGLHFYNRASFVVQEIERVEKACVDLEHNDLEAFGRKMFATHEGLRSLYEVSCAELDFLVDQVKDNPNVPGARMMGGGFGGCTINLVKSDQVADFASTSSAAYRTVFNMDLKSYMVSLEDGTSVVCIN